ncbi:helix-turn-helix transcriptional regulator [Amycolatopsis jiangsuensis]|uniref:Putative ArsR family transcriptional regulator n=1 Tax=Amycolatopsis jiangsuensis TaxID=1181879 RepID=A0A840IUP7_9PSEU|nr:transcriptional regulator [Amycolatopsis jiangsuensis]MBB4684878.1 putative ArsR family transcriptional regulator [Amycolatopsis jiangsuensis]
MTSERATISAVAALDEDLRHGMYAFIRGAHHPVTREEAAAAVGISRKLAAFHLDKLVTAGLLRARYETAGKVGRAPKVYEPTPTDFSITIPPRRPDVLSAILIDAVVSATPSESAKDAALRTAAQHGEEAGAAERARTRPGRLGAERGLTLAGEVLARHGFEPSRETPVCLRLRNCPFHPLAARAPDLVCGLTRNFLTGVLGGLAVPGVATAAVPPPAGGCCVELRGTN